MSSSSDQVTKERLVRLTLLCYRNPELSEEEFHQYWREKHAPLVREWLSKYGTIRYTQYHTPSEMRETANKMPSPLPLADYDGFVELVLRDIDDYIKAREDPFYKEKVAQDEAKFFDAKRSKMTVGWEEVYVQDGKAVDTKLGEAAVITEKGLKKSGYSLPTCQ